MNRFPKPPSLLPPSRPSNPQAVGATRAALGLPDGDDLMFYTMNTIQDSTVMFQSGASCGTLRACRCAAHVYIMMMICGTSARSRSLSTLVSLD